MIIQKLTSAKKKHFVRSFHSYHSYHSFNPLLHQKGSLKTPRTVVQPSAVVHDSPPLVACCGKSKRSLQLQRVEVVHKTKLFSPGQHDNVVVVQLGDPLTWDEHTSATANTPARSRQQHCHTCHVPKRLGSRSTCFITLPVEMSTLRSVDSPYRPVLS